jgi:F-type H+-transporting ATPase subunit delta
MAELATIARPYAEALMKASRNGDARALASEIQAVAAVAGHHRVQGLAENPKVGAEQVQDLIAGVLGKPLGAPAANLLRMVIENGRLSAVQEIARQFQGLVDAETGISQAHVESAFPLDAAQLVELRETMERRFGRKLDMTVAVDPALIGGVRVAVGDEVLDTSIRARLEQMKAALVA